MGPRSLLRRAAVEMVEPNILASASSIIEPSIVEAYKGDDMFQDHVRWTMAQRLAELIFARMDYRVEPDHHSGGTRYTASIRALNQKQWEDLGRLIDDKAALNQIVVLKTNDH